MIRWLIILYYFSTYPGPQCTVSPVPELSLPLLLCMKTRGKREKKRTKKDKKEKRNLREKTGRIKKRRRKITRKDGRKIKQKRKDNKRQFSSTGVPSTLHSILFPISSGPKIPDFFPSLILTKSNNKIYHLTLSLNLFNMAVAKEKSKSFHVTCQLCALI